MGLNSGFKGLTETDRPMYMSATLSMHKGARRFKSWVHRNSKRSEPNSNQSLSMEFAAEVHRTEGLFWRLKSKLNKMKSLKFRFDTLRSAVSRRVDNITKPLKNVLKNLYSGEASEQLNCVIFVNPCFVIFFFCGAATQCGSWPPHSWGF